MAAPGRENGPRLAFLGAIGIGTRGGAIQADAESVKIHGQYVPVRAEVVSTASLSAHADAGEILGWLGGFTRAPGRTFVVHGEPVSEDALRHRIVEEKGLACSMPDYREKFELQ